MEITGNIHGTNALTKRKTTSTTSITRIETNLLKRNRNIIRHLSRANNPTLLQQCWDMSPAEYKKGWLSKPTPDSQHDRTFTILSPRFCIAEQHGTQQMKYRVIDDLAKPQVNQTVEMNETYRPQDLDTFMVVARLQHLFGAQQLRMWSADF